MQFNTEEPIPRQTVRSVFVGAARCIATNTAISGFEKILGGTNTGFEAHVQACRRSRFQANLGQRSTPHIWTLLLATLRALRSFFYQHHSCDWPVS